MSDRLVAATEGCVSQRLRVLGRRSLGEVALARDFLPTSVSNPGLLRVIIASDNAGAHAAIGGEQSIHVPNATRTKPDTGAKHQRLGATRSDRANIAKIHDAHCKEQDH